MNKTQLIDKVAEKAEITKADAKKAVDALFEAVGDALQDANDGKVAILGFGTFSVSERGERIGRNPQTKQEITIPAKKVIKFKAGSELEAKL
ncbi:MAG: HU family DNA-binding protein [Marinilabiliaceae bacterium]